MLLLFLCFVFDIVASFSCNHTALMDCDGSGINVTLICSTSATTPCETCDTMESCYLCRTQGEVDAVWHCGDPRCSAPRYLSGQELYYTEHTTGGVFKTHVLGGSAQLITNVGGTGIGISYDPYFQSLLVAIDAGITYLVDATSGDKMRISDIVDSREVEVRTYTPWNWYAGTSNGGGNGYLVLYEDYGTATTHSKSIETNYQRVEQIHYDYENDWLYVADWEAIIKIRGDLTSMVTLYDGLTECTGIALDGDDLYFTESNAIMKGNTSGKSVMPKELVYSGLFGPGNLLLDVTTTPKMFYWTSGTQNTIRSAPIDKSFPIFDIQTGVFGAHGLCFHTRGQSCSDCNSTDCEVCSEAVHSGSYPEWETDPKKMVFDCGPLATAGEAPTCRPSHANSSCGECERIDTCYSCRQETPENIVWGCVEPKCSSQPSRSSCFDCDGQKCSACGEELNNVDFPEWNTDPKTHLVDCVDGTAKCLATLEVNSCSNCNNVSQCADCVNFGRFEDAHWMCGSPSCQVFQPPATDRTYIYFSDHENDNFNIGTLLGGPIVPVSQDQAHGISHIPSAGKLLVTNFNTGVYLWNEFPKNSETGVLVSHPDLSSGNLRHAVIKSYELQTYFATKNTGEVYLATMDVSESPRVFMSPSLKAQQMSYDKETDTLYVAGDTVIFTVDGNLGNCRQLYNSTHGSIVRVTGLTRDGDDLYWTDSNDGIVYKGSTDGSLAPVVIWETGLTSLEHIAIDVYSDPKMLYWTAYDTKKVQAGRADSGGTHYDLYSMSNCPLGIEVVRHQHPPKKLWISMASANQVAIGTDSGNGVSIFGFPNAVGIHHIPSQKKLLISHGSDGVYLKAQDGSGAYEKVSHSIISGDVRHAVLRSWDKQTYFVSLGNGVVHLASFDPDIAPLRSFLCPDIPSQMFYDKVSDVLFVASTSKIFCINGDLDADSYKLIYGGLNGAIGLAYDGEGTLFWTDGIDNEIFAGSVNGSLVPVHLYGTVGTPQHIVIDNEADPKMLYWVDGFGNMISSAPGSVDNPGFVFSVYSGLFGVPTGLEIQRKIETRSCSDCTDISTCHSCSDDINSVSVADWQTSPSTMHFDCDDAGNAACRPSTDTCSGCEFISDCYGCREKTQAEVIWRCMGKSKCSVHPDKSSCFDCDTHRCSFCGEEVNTADFVEWRTTPTKHALDCDDVSGDVVCAPTTERSCVSCGNVSSCYNCLEVLQQEVSWMCASPKCQMSPVGQSFYVYYGVLNEVRRLTYDGSLQTEFPKPISPVGISYFPPERKLLVTSSISGVYLMNESAGSEIQISHPDLNEFLVHAVVKSWADQTYFASGYSNGTIFLAKMDKSPPLKRIYLSSGEAYQMTYEKGTDTLYVAGGSGVFKVDVNLENEVKLYGGNNITGIARAGHVIYWTENSDGSIFMGYVDGSTEQLLYSTAGSPNHIATDSVTVPNMLYWTDSEQNMLLKAVANGLGPVQIISSGGAGYFGIDLVSAEFIDAPPSCSDCGVAGCQNCGDEINSDTGIYTNWATAGVKHVVKCNGDQSAICQSTADTLEKHCESCATASSCYNCSVHADDNVVWGCGSPKCSLQPSEVKGCFDCETSTCGDCGLVVNSLGFDDWYTVPENHSIDCKPGFESPTCRATTAKCRNCLSASECYKCRNVSHADMLWSCGPVQCDFRSGTELTEVCSDCSDQPNCSNCASDIDSTMPDWVSWPGTMYFYESTISYCQPNGYENGDFVYYFMDDPMTWIDAENDCRTRFNETSHLASIPDLLVENFLREAMLNHTRRSDTTDNEYWMGLNIFRDFGSMESINGNWEFTDGTLYDGDVFQAWINVGPSFGTNAFCVTKGIWNIGGIEGWSNRDCSVERGYICQVEKNSGVTDPWENVEFENWYTYCDFHTNLDCPDAWAMCDGVLVYDDECSGVGKCRNERIPFEYLTVCVCNPGNCGSSCTEVVDNAELDNVNDIIYVTYEVDTSLDSSEFPTEPYECADFVQSAGLFSLGSIVQCSWELNDEQTKTTKLKIHLGSGNNVIPSNIIKIRPITDPDSENCTLVVGSFEQGDDSQSDDTVDPTSTFPILATLLGVIIPISVIGILVLISILVVVIVLVVVLLKRKKVDKMDVVLEEETDKTVAKIKIKIDLFKIDYKKINVIKKIGKGGSDSIIFLVDWNKTQCAFKCFMLNNLEENKFAEFEKEVEIMGSVNHPNILRFFGATYAPPRVGIVMEFCENGDIKVFLGKNKDYSIENRIRLLFETAKGMNYLHERNIIHRDLKCENVLITSEEKCRIIDFGLSRCVERMSVQKTARIGTSYYMAPEVVTGEEYTTLVDVFSFAIMWFEVLTGNFTPFGDTATFHLEFKIANDDSFRPDSSEVDLPKDKTWMIDLMELCWDRDPKKRRSMENLCECFEKGEIVEVPEDNKKKIDM